MGGSKLTCSTFWIADQCLPVVLRWTREEYDMSSSMGPNAGQYWWECSVVAACFIGLHLVKKCLLFMASTLNISVAAVHSYGLRRRMQPSSLLDVWNTIRIELQGPGTYLYFDTAYCGCCSSSRIQMYALSHMMTFFFVFGFSIPWFFQGTVISLHPTPLQGLMVFCHL